MKAAHYLLAAPLLFGCGDSPDPEPTWEELRERKITGEVIADGLHYIEGFGHYYRPVIDVGNDVRPYVVVGEEERLRDLDERISPGDSVSVPEYVMMFSLDMERVITPEEIVLEDAQ